MIFPSKPQIQLLRELGYQKIDFEYLTYNQKLLMPSSTYGHVVMVHVDSGGESQGDQQEL